MKLIIVESPNKTRTIQGYLGAGYVVAASFGHIRDLPQTKQGVNAPDFRPEYQIIDRSKGHVQKLRDLASRASEVYLATDPDREGEAISWHLAEVLGLKHARRITFQEVTKRAISQALETPRLIDMHLVQAQEARRVLDRLVGWRVSTLVQRIVKGAKSAGRTQTPAVRLVVEREEAILGHSQVQHYGARITFSAGWAAEWDTKPWRGQEEYILSRALAERAAACREFQVEASGTKPRTQQPPAPFSTSTLLQAASATLKFDPKRTQGLAQALFEGGHITYHRTDSLNLSVDAIAAVRGLAASKGWALPEAARRWSAKEDAQEAHEAIRPTHFETAVAGNNDDERALYRLIWERAVACQLAAAEFAETTTRLVAVEPDGDRFHFVARSKVLTSPGWRVLTAEDATNEGAGEGGEGDCGVVPVLDEGTRLTGQEGTVLVKKTEPPSRFTKAGLVAALEKAGIGRPSTYAALIDTILARGYVAEKKNALVPTEVGVDLIRSLRGKFRFADLDFTRGAETALDAVAAGKLTYLAVVTRMNEQLDAELGQVLADRGISLTGPTESALKMAASLAEQLGVEIPADALRDRQQLSAWIDGHMAQVQEARKQRMAGEPATEGQIRALTAAIEKGTLAAPAGWPSISKLEASNAIERIGAKRQPSAPGKAKRGSGSSRGKRKAS